MMALDFFSSSSSESAAFGGFTGGRAVSRFTEGGQNRSETLQFQSSQQTGSGALKIVWGLASPKPAHLILLLSPPSPLPASRPRSRSSERLDALRSPSGWEGRSLLRSSTSLLKLRLVAGVRERSRRSPRSPPRSLRSRRSPRSPAFSPRSRLKLLLEERQACCLSPVLLRHSLL